MGYRTDWFAPGEVYHLYTRGVNRLNIFRSDTDRERCIELLKHCLPQGKITSFSVARRLKHELSLTTRGDGLVDLLAYCLMDNHVHLLVQENFENGTSQYMQRVLNAYASYFNRRYNRSGPLFTSRFKSVYVGNDEQLLHVSRYIHLNPYAAHMVDNPLDYSWSSLQYYVHLKKDPDCHIELIHSMADCQKYTTFILDEADYARSIADAKHALIDFDD